MSAMKPSPIRSALRALWDLNVQTMPTAALWAVTFWFIIESHSFAIRFVALFFANLATIVSAVLIVKDSPAIRKPNWKESIFDRFSWTMLMGTGFPFCLALENVSRLQSSNYLEKLIFLSISISCLMLWLFAVIVLAPLALRRDRSEDATIVLVEALGILQRHKRQVLTSLAVLILAWPLFFVYAFLALTFSQCMTLTTSSGDIDAAMSSPDTRGYLA